MSERRAIWLSNAPAVQGLSFRHYEGDRDLPAIVDVLNRSMLADDDEFLYTIEDVRLEYINTANFDPSEDVLIAELEGQPVGVAYTRWNRKPEGVRLYEHHAHLVPEARFPGLRQSMVLWSEQRLKTIASTHQTPDSKKFEVWTKQSANEWRELALANGYEDDWHLFEMKRPNLENIPDCALPQGIEIKPVTKENFRSVFAACREAFMDDRGFSEDRWGEDRYREFLEHPKARFDLWRVAWSGNEVVGGVGVTISEEENAAFARKRAWANHVFVRRTWRKQGIARALLATTLKALRDEGFEEAALTVDTDNPSGALRLYKQLGFVECAEFIFVTKPVQ